MNHLYMNHVCLTNVYKNVYTCNGYSNLLGESEIVPYLGRMRHKWPCYDRLLCRYEDT